MEVTAPDKPRQRLRFAGDSLGDKSTAAVWAQWLAFASSAAIVLGIAPSQILLGLSLAALLVSAVKLRLPPIKLPLALFLLGTLLAVALSGDPKAGWPQVKKIFVFAQLLVVYSLVRRREMARWLVLSWGAFGAASALLGVGQFAVKFYRVHQQHQDFYTGYVAQRITGFMSHWYTFSVEEMIALLMLGSFALFSPSARKRRWIWGGLALAMCLGILLAETRAVWIATMVGAGYLAWRWRPWLALAIPVAAVVVLLVAPAAIQQRAVSIVRPGADDSNAFRQILRRTGVRMIEAHPWFGLGPEMPRKKFFDYLPPDVPLPLPSGSTMHLHNLYLEYAAERGIPVLLVLLWLLGKITWDFLIGERRLPRAPDERRFLLHGGVAMILSLLVEGWADVNLGDSEILTMFLVVVALGYIALDQQQREPQAGVSELSHSAGVKIG